jgi:hypothetical protein
MLTKNLTARMYRNHLLKSESTPVHVFQDIAGTEQPPSRQRRARI